MYKRSLFYIIIFAILSFTMNPAFAAQQKNNKRQPGARTIYSTQLGIYRTRDEALQLQKRLANHQIPTLIEKRKVGQHTLYRVLTQPTQSKAHAKAMQAHIKHQLVSDKGRSSVKRVQNQSQHFDSQRLYHTDYRVGTLRTNSATKYNPYRNNIVAYPRPLAPPHNQTLTSVVDYAMSFNPDIRFAVNRRNASYQGYMQARADYFPSVDLAAGAGHERSKNPTASAIAGGRIEDLNRYESSLVVDEKLFTGFGVSSEVARNRALTSADAFKIAGVANDVALDITEQYINILRDRELVKEAKANVSEHRDIMGMIENRTGAGIDRKVDLRQAEGRLDLARANLIAAEHNLDDAEVRFTHFTGIYPSNLSHPHAPTKPFIPASEQAAVKIAMANHPTLKAAQEDVREAIAQHGASNATNWPHLNLILSASRNRNLDGIPGDNNDEMAMLRVNYNLFRGGKDIARQRETAYQIQEAEETKNNTVLEIEETMRLAWNALMQTQNRLPRLLGHLRSSKATLAAYDEQFKVGRRSLFDLLDTQNEYYLSRIEYTAARYDELLARYRVLNAEGKLLGFLHVPLPAAADPTVKPRFGS